MMRRSLCRSETENTTVVRKRGGGGRRGRRSSSRRSNLVDETCSSPQLRERRQTTTTTTATTSITPPAPARTTSTITSKDSTRSYNSILNEHRDRLHKVIRKVYNYIRFSNLVDKWKYVDECLTDNRRMLLKQLSVYSAPAAPVAAAAGGNDDQDNAFHANNNTDGNPVPLCEPIRIPLMCDQYTFFGVKINNENHNVPVTVIPHVDPLPSFSMWSTVQQNFSVEDEKELTNLPYIGDEEVQEDRNFFDELLDNYDGNYHGNFPFEFDEAVLCELVELTHYVWSDITVYCGLSSRQSSQIGANCSVGDADNADGHDEATTSGVDNELRNGRSEGNILTVYEVLGITESTEGDSSLSSPEVKRVKDCGIPYEVFVAIAGTFGSAGDTNKLKDRYVEMKRRADNSQLNEETPMPCPNLDNPFEVHNAVISGRHKTPTRGDALHSYRTLFCRRCFKYDCCLHPYKSTPSMWSHRWPVNGKTNVEMDGPYCGSWCVRKLVNDTAAQNSMNNNTNNVCDATRAPSNMEWSLDEKCLYEVLAPLFIPYGDPSYNLYNWCCRLSKLLGTKKCCDVLAYTNTQDLSTLLKPDSGQLSTLRVPGTGEEWCQRSASTASLDGYDCAESTGSCSGSVQGNGEFCDELLMGNESSSCNGVVTTTYRRKRAKKHARRRTVLELPTPCEDEDENSQTSASYQQHGGNNSVLPVGPSSHHYHPCDHPGKRCDKSCLCKKAGTFCEKFCQCPPDCRNRFPGCRCRGQCNTKLCPCFLAVRECDPDLCVSCGAQSSFGTLNSLSDFLNALKISSPRVTGTCRNVAIQRGWRKHLLMAPSDVSGWGIFIKDGAEKNEFIYEYCGEIISQDEADRRGKIYDKTMSSFLFNLNRDFVVDATRKGNKIRFANHSVNPNCYAKVVMVNGDHRIGIFAKRAILPGEELFFDYRYGPMEQLKYVGIERGDKDKPGTSSGSNSGGGEKVRSALRPLNESSEFPALR